ncbi:MAG: DUF1743 domain-containing protein [Candidatus Thermoplasmatota archaeon]|nr:DUF1743 domain-containing protein [Candidatus Thermoplasmatota archaeon]MEC8681591.1 DUF1743 domain-containing protein [Candidatus Thermoplasmatota archaeon]
MGWLGLDDTDSLAGGCTTEVFDTLLRHLPVGASTGVPRLVRLWPFAQRRTRGNAALAVEIHTNDIDGLLGHLDTWWADHLAPLRGKMEPSLVSDRDQFPASPGMVWFDQPPPPSVYFDSVRSHVSIDSLPEPTRAWGGHGRIGATAAVAWPALSCTWEAIAWRLEGEDHRPRRVDVASLAVVDGWPDTFLSRDPRKGTNLIAPRGNSPVLFGLRATSFETAERGCQRLLEGSGTEQVDRWRVFQTNQASGDHLGPEWTLTVERVDVHPTRKHATVLCGDVSVRAYAEGGPVNALARWLMPGDEISVAGLTDADGMIHAERLKIEAWVPRAQQRPRCPDCDVRMKSMGTNQGLRCPKCKLRSEDAWVEVEAHPPHRSWVEPPASARRHLARPLEWDESH